MGGGVGRARCGKVQINSRAAGCSSGKWHQGDRALHCFPSPDTLDANLAEKGVGGEGKGRAHLGMKMEKHLIDRVHECTRINFPLLKGTRPQGRH